MTQAVLLINDLVPYSAKLEEPKPEEEASIKKIIADLHKNNELQFNKRKKKRKEPHAIRNTGHAKAHGILAGTLDGPCPTSPTTCVRACSRSQERHTRSSRGSPARPAGLAPTACAACAGCGTQGFGSRGRQGGSAVPKRRTKTLSSSPNPNFCSRTRSDYSKQRNADGKGPRTHTRTPQ